MIWPAPLSPRVLVGLAAVAFIAVALGFIYTKGYNSAEAKCAERIEQIRAEILQNTLRRQNGYIMALQNQNRREREASQIDDIPRPNIGLCDAGDVWLHSIQDSVRIANHTASPD